MNSSAFLSSIAVGLIQWWIWCAGLVLLLALAVKVAGERRPAIHDLLCRALVVLELVLLPASLALCLKDLPWTGPAVAAPDPAPAPVVKPTPVRVEPAPAVLVESAAHPPAVNVSVAAAVAPATPRSALPLPIGLPPWAAGSIVAVYIAGVLVGSARLARRLRKSFELAATRGGPPPEPLLETLRAVERRMGVLRPVRLAMAEAVSVPLLAGWRRPAILLPPALAGRLSPAALEPLLAHELAHHVRRDVPWKLAHAIAAVLAWPVPLQRRAGRTMARASEVLCDRLAAADAPGREAYARALFEVLAASRGAPSIAFGASAMASKSFLRRRIEIVLAAGDIPARLSRARTLALLLVVAACAAPVLALQVRAKPEGPAPAPAKPAPVIRNAALAAGQEGDDTPEPIRRAQDELRKLLRAQAAVEYTAGRHDQAAGHLRRAHELGATGVELVPLGGTVGALDLGRSASPFVFWAIEKKFGPLRIDPGYVVDPGSGLLVQEMPILEKIRSGLFPAQAEEKIVSFQMRFIRLGAEEAAGWARVLGEDRNGGPEWSHALTAEESARLEARIQERAAAKDKACVVEQAPTLTVFDGMSASIVIARQTSYIEKYQLVAKGETQVADPVLGVLNDGMEAECLPRVLADRSVRGLFRITRTHLRGLQKVFIDLPPWAQGVPIEVPILEKDARFHDAVIAEGFGTILGQAPATDEEKLHGPLERSWLWVKCQVVAPEDR